MLFTRVLCILVLICVNVYIGFWDSKAEKSETPRAKTLFFHPEMAPRGKIHLFI